MRTKVFLLKGFANLGPYVTLAEFERINVDYVACIVALKKPQYLPFEIKSASQVEARIMEVVDHWESIDMCHFLTSEYAEMVLDRGALNIRVVEGRIMENDWVYSMVKAIHKNNKQRIVEGTFEKCNESFLKMKIDDMTLTLEESINYMKVYGSLG